MKMQKDISAKRGESQSEQLHRITRTAAVAVFADEGPRPAAVYKDPKKEEYAIFLKPGTEYADFVDALNAIDAMEREAKAGQPRNLQGYPI